LCVWIYILGAIFGALAAAGSALLILFLLRRKKKKKEKEKENENKSMQLNNIPIHERRFTFETENSTLLSTLSSIHFFPFNSIQTKIHIYY
jgi:hypothetical protein